MSSGPYTDFVLLSAGANALSTVGTPGANFQNQQRRLLGVFTSNSTNGLQTVVMKLGRPLATLDGSVFAAAAGFVDVEETYDPWIPIQVQLNNTTGGAINNVTVIVRFLTQP